MTGEQLTGELLTGDVITGNQSMFGSPDSIGNAVSFYKQLVVGILPLLKQIGFWLLVVLVVFIVLLLIFNVIASKGRKRIQLKDKQFRKLTDEENDTNVQEKDQTSDNPTMDHGGDN